MSRRRTSAIVTCGIAALCGGVVGALRAVRGDVPPPPSLPDEARDLPAMPDPDDNGWFVIADTADGTFDREPPTRDLLDARGPPRVEELELLRGDLETYAPSDDAVRAIDQALAAPRFAIDCPLSLLDAQCPAIAWHHAHGVAAALVLRDAIGGFDAEALARTERLLVADRDAIEHARTPVAQMIAQVGAERSIELAAMLGAVIGAREDAAASREILAAIDGLELALVSLEPERWSLEHAVIGQWITLQRTADELEAGAHPLRFDHARVSSVIGRYHEAVLAHLRDPTAHAMPEPPEPDRAWIFYDTPGASMIAMLMPYGTLATRVRDGAERATDRIEVARVALAAGRARAERALAQP